eukprot:3219088-Rhodomonas_salina.2
MAGAGAQCQPREAACQGLPALPWQCPTSRAVPDTASREQLCHVRARHCIAVPDLCPACSCPCCTSTRRTGTLHTC